MAGQSSAGPLDTYHLESSDVAKLGREVVVRNFPITRPFCSKCGLRPDAHGIPWKPSVSFWVSSLAPMFRNNERESIGQLEGLRSLD
jgi:hypothetical protein